MPNLTGRTILITGAAIAIVLLAPFPATAAEDVREEFCGYVYPVEGYSADIGGLEISLPLNNRLIVNGETVAEHGRRRDDPSPQAWRDSANTAEVGLTHRHLLVRTLRTDCVDLAWSHIYMLDRATGELRAAGALPSVHHRHRLGTEGDGLIYTNTWLCSPQGGAPAGRAFVHVLREGGEAFEQEERDWATVCSDDAWRRFGSIYFAPMQPVVPESAAGSGPGDE